MAIKAVSFDLGHTLVFPRYQTYIELVAGAGVTITPAQVQGVERDLRLWFDRIVASGRMHEGVWTDYYVHFFAALGVPDEHMREVLLGLRDRHREQVGLWTEPDPEAEPVLEEVKERGLKVVCISNNDGRLQAMITHLGWQHRFDLLVDSRQVGIEKPDPAIFRHAFTALDLQPDEWVHVGDYYEVDVVGARRAGARGVLFDPGGAYGEMDCPVISNLCAVRHHLG